MTDKTDKPQQQTLSVRLSEALRQRLECARQLGAAKTGESISTSDIAKQLLESAREDRLEVVDLVAEPTKALAARGHYYTTQIREAPRIRERAFKPPIPR